MKPVIDDIDSAIIGLLQKNGRMPNTEIAQNIGIAEATVRKRLHRLLADEIIQIVAVSSPMKLGFEIAGTVKIKADNKKTDQIIAALKQLDPLWYIGHLTGAFDFDLEFTVESHLQLKELLERINKIDGVLSSETAFLLQYVRNRYDWGTPIVRKPDARQPDDSPPHLSTQK